MEQDIQIVSIHIVDDQESFETIQSIFLNLQTILSRKNGNGFPRYLLLKHRNSVQILADKAKLLSSSLFFKSAFSNFREQAEHQIVIHWNVLSAIQVVEMIHGHHLNLSFNNVKSIFEAAEYFGAEVVLDACVDWILALRGSQLAHHRFLWTNRNLNDTFYDLMQLWLITTPERFRAAAKILEDMAATDFTHLRMLDVFPETPMSLILAILDNPNLTTPSEDFLCEAIITWINSNKEEEVTRLVQKISFDLLSVDFRLSNMFQTFHRSFHHVILQPDRLLPSKIRISSQSTVLDLSGCPQITVNHFPDSGVPCTTVRVLDLSNCQRINGYDLRERIGPLFPNLTVLWLRNTRLNSSSLSLILNLFPHLIEVDFSVGSVKKHNKRQKDSAGYHASAERGLRRLNLRGRSDITDNWLVGIRDLVGSLESLDISVCENITDYGIASFLARRNEMEELRASGTLIGYRSTQSLTANSLLYYGGTGGKLWFKVLDLGHCTKMPESILMLDFARLSEVNFRYTGVLDEHVIRLCSANLKKLNLRETKITNATVDAILDGCPYLTYLNVRGCKLKDIKTHGMKSLKCLQTQKMGWGFRDTFLGPVTNLCSLTVGIGGTITDRGISLVAELSRNTLQSINFTMQALSNSSMVTLIENCVNLQKLTLRQSLGHFSRALVAAIAQRGDTLKVLNLEGTCEWLEDADVALIVAQCRNLTAISFQSHHNLTEKSIHSLQEHIPGVQKLILRDCENLLRNCEPLVLIGFEALRELTIQRCSGKFQSNFAELASHKMRLLDTLTISQCDFEVGQSDLASSKMLLGKPPFTLHIPRCQEKIRCK